MRGCHLGEASPSPRSAVREGGSPDEDHADGRAAAQGRRGPEQGPRGGKGGFFLRAEKMHELFTAVGPEGPWADRFGGVDLHARSHGQAFIQVLKTRVEEQGLYLFDEPEAALSFTSCLGLIALLARIPSEGSQAIVAT